MSAIQPVALNRTENRELIIQWSDGREQILSYRELRESCQCANCMEKRLNSKPEPPGMLKILSAAEAQPLDIIKMEPVGNYAYNIEFNDGHTSGIFSFDLLRSIS